MSSLGSSIPVYCFPEQDIKDEHNHQQRKKFSIEHVSNIIGHHDKRFHSRARMIIGVKIITENDHIIFIATKLYPKLTTTGLQKGTQAERH